MPPQPRALPPGRARSRAGSGSGSRSFERLAGGIRPRAPGPDPDPGRARQRGRRGRSGAARRDRGAAERLRGLVRGRRAARRARARGRDRPPRHRRRARACSSASRRCAEARPIEVTDDRGAVHRYRVVGVDPGPEEALPHARRLRARAAPGARARDLRRALRRGARVPGQRARVRSRGLMETPPPISFARGAPSLDIVAVDELRAAAQRAFENDPGGTTAYGTAVGYVPLREWIAEYQQVAPEQVVVTNGSMQADAFLFRLLVRARRPRDRRGADLRPHAALPARARRRAAGDPAPGGRRRRRGDRTRLRGGRAAEARAHHPQLPQPRRVHAVAREAPSPARPGADLRLRRLRGRPLRRAALRGRDAADDALDRRRGPGGLRVVVLEDGLPGDPGRIPRRARRR